MSAAGERLALKEHELADWKALDVERKDRLKAKEEHLDALMQVGRERHGLCGVAYWQPVWRASLLLRLCERAHSKTPRTLLTTPGARRRAQVRGEHERGSAVGPGGRPEEAAAGGEHQAVSG